MTQPRSPAESLRGPEQSRSEWPHLLCNPHPPSPHLTSLFSQKRGKGSTHTDKSCPVQSFEPGTRGRGQGFCGSVVLQFARNGRRVEGGEKLPFITPSPLPAPCGIDSVPITLLFSLADGWPNRIREGRRFAQGHTAKASSVSSPCFGPCPGRSHTCLP